MSGYWAQQVKVKPNTTYRFTVRSKLNSGIMLIYVTGGSDSDATRLDTRSYVFALDNQQLVPLFWKPEWVTGTKPYPGGTSGPVTANKTMAAPNEWTTITRTFPSGPHALVALQLGVFFTAGDYWFDDASLTEMTE